MTMKDHLTPAPADPGAARPGPAAGPPGARPGPGRRRALLVVLSAAMLIDALEVSIVIVALPSISAALRVPASTVQWVMTGFALGFGAMLLFGGRVVRRLGERPAYLAALLAYAALCVAGGLAGTSTLLIATRVARGCCVALTAPTGLAIIAGTFPPGPARNRALAVYAAFGASGFTAGLLLSGLLTEIQWRWTFLFPAPVALVLVALGWRLIPRTAPAGAAGAPGAGAGRGPGGRPRYDLAGAITFAGAAALLVTATATAPEHGPALTAAAVAAAGLLLAGFAVAERRAADPLLRLGLLRNGTLIRAGLGAAALNGSYWGLLLITTFQLQDGAAWPPLLTAVAILPASLPPMLAAPWAGSLVRRLGAQRLIIGGAVAATAGYAVAVASSPPVPYLSRLLPTLLLVGAGYVGAFSALHMQVLASVPADAARMTTSVYQAFVQIGGALTLAVLAALIAARGRAFGPSAAGTAHAIAASYHPAAAVITAVSAVGIAAGLASLPAARRNRGRADEPAP